MKKILPLVLLCGCSLFPQNKSTQSDAKTAGSAASQHESTIKKVVEGTPQAPLPKIEVHGTNNSVRVSIGHSPYREEIDIEDQAGVQSESSSSMSSKFKVSLPWGLTLLFAAAGILALLYALKKGKQAIQSTAGGAAIWSAADEALARIGAGIEKKIATSTDPVQNASFSADKHEVSEIRRKLQAKHGPPPQP